MCILVREHEDAISERDNKITELTEEVARLGRMEQLQQQEYDELDKQLRDAKAEVERLCRGQREGEL